MKKIILTLSLALIATIGFAQIRATTDKKGNLCIENNGKIIVKENFEKVSSYDWDAKLIPAKLNGKWGFYNEEGKLVIAHLYEGMMFQNPAELYGWYDRKQNSIQVFIGGKKLFIDKTGAEVSAPEYELVIETTHPGAGYFFKKGGKWALADKDKKVLTEFKYDKIIGPIGINPYVYRGTRDGQDYRLNTAGQEEAAIESNSNSNSSADKKEEKTNEKHKWTCDGCKGTEITDGANKRPSPNKTHCTNPKVKNSTSHSWDYTGKVK